MSRGPEAVKVLSTGDLWLFTADQGPKVASGGCSAVRGSRFESMGALVVGLGELVRDHYARVGSGLGCRGRGLSGRA
jgi:hypothetical protein